MTDLATRLALADCVEHAELRGRSLRDIFTPSERRMIVTALRVIPQEPVAWRCDWDWLSDATTNPGRVEDWRRLGRKITPLAPIQSSDGRTDEAKARESVAAVADDESHKRDIGARRPHGSPSSNDHESSDQAGVGSERSSPSEPIAQGQREAVIEQCAKLCDEIVARADRCMNDPKAARMILAAFGNGAMECAESIRALAPSAQEVAATDAAIHGTGFMKAGKHIPLSDVYSAEPVTDGIVREGDRLGYEVNEETGVGRITSHTRPMRGGGE